MKETNDKLFNLRISSELREALRLDAYNKDMSLSEVARMILESYYNLPCQKVPCQKAKQKK